MYVVVYSAFSLSLNVFINIGLFDSGFDPNFSCCSFCCCLITIAEPLAIPTCRTLESASGAMPTPFSWGSCYSVDASISNALNVDCDCVIFALKLIQMK